MKERMEEIVKLEEKKVRERRKEEGESSKEEIERNGE